MIRARRTTPPLTPQWCWLTQHGDQCGGGASRLLRLSRRLCRRPQTLLLPPGQLMTAAGNAPTDSNSGAPHTLVDMADAIGRLLRPRSHCCKLVEAWQLARKPYLISAVAGGQWPQARLAAMRVGVDDNRCQPCVGAMGALGHRHICPATRPEGCCLAPLEGAARLSQSLSPERRLLLQTRGLLVIRMAVPPPAECDTLIWLRPPPNDVDDDDWQWYIDGSLLDEPRRFARRTGFAIVVVDSCTRQVAFGYGWPPVWVETAATAEAWAYSVVVGLTPMAPAITTDCLEVLKTLSAAR